MKKLIIVSDPKHIRSVNIFGAVDIEDVVFKTPSYILGCRDLSSSFYLSYMTKLLQLMQVDHAT